MILPGMFPGAVSASSVPPSGLTFLGRQDDDTATNVFNFTIDDDTSTERRIIVAVCTHQNAERTIDSVEIGGGATVVHININAASTANDTDLAIVSRLVPAGESSDVEVTTNFPVDVCVVGVWRLDGETTATCHDVATDTTLSGATLSVTIDIPENGALIAAQCAAMTSGPFNWTGVDEDDGNLLTEIQFTFASRQGMSAEAGHVISGSHSGAIVVANTSIMGAISWQYA